MHLCNHCPKPCSWLASFMPRICSIALRNEIMSLIELIYSQIDWRDRAEFLTGMGINEACYSRTDDQSCTPDKMGTRESSKLECPNLGLIGNAKRKSGREDFLQFIDLITIYCSVIYLMFLSTLHLLLCRCCSGYE